MGGVDHFDHFRASYPLGPKSRKNWHRLFWFLLEAAVINSCIVYMTSHSERRNTHKEFRLRLGRDSSTIFRQEKSSRPCSKTKKGGTISVPEEIRKSDVGSHMPNLHVKKSNAANTCVKFARYLYVLALVLKCFTNKIKQILSFNLVLFYLLQLSVYIHLSLTNCS